ncbi:DUF1134 domain-containing protein [Devosia chinhatensis]|uniref:DUF1134 domain-containing protein n=2 Tax=Devosia aurantiaca TaxID=2714858 RepID=A0A6M1SF54_9HYPH|nr:DUF1134 domain-containing protein [Devosia aurantiaca]
MRSLWRARPKVFLSRLVPRGDRTMLKKIAQLLGVVLALAMPAAPAMAQQGGSLTDTFSGEEIINNGQEFFGSAAQGLASVVERAVSQYGQPNGYILGEEAGGALFIGAKYGEGTLYTRNAGQFSIYWQGPSIGLDIGGDGSKVMMLVYNLTSIQDILGRYPGVDGSAYVIGGVGMTVTKRANVIVVPIRSGVGARLGINVGYLNFTAEPTWNPF